MMMYSFMQRTPSTTSGSVNQAESKSTKMTTPTQSSATQMEAWMKDLQDFKVDRGEMNQLVMNYLVQEGFKEAAERFRFESGVEHGAHLDLLDERVKVREAVQNGDIDTAIDLTNTLNPDILDSKPHLYFHLQQQKLIELIRERNTDRALEFAQNVLAELGTEHTEFLDELEKTMALLAYDTPETSPFGHLMKPTQRHMVASEVNAAILETQHQETVPKLAGVVKLLMWTQNELDKKHVKYPKMTDIAEGNIKTSLEQEKASTSTNK